VARGETVAEKFLLRWRGEADPRHVKAIDTYWICTAEHGLNASTFTARVVASTGADCGAALSSAVGALSGPLHGGAPAYVKPMLEEVARMGDAERWVREALESGKRIMGFGHRVYRHVDDPRATILRHLSKRLGEAAGDTRWFDISEAVEKIVLEQKGLRPNVDFYAGSVLHYLGLATDLFTPTFAAARASGWTAHIREQYADNRIIRPESEYIGPRDQVWVPADQRGPQPEEAAS
jgi:citrate synthase